MQNIIDWFLILFFPFILIAAVLWYNIATVMQYRTINQLKQKGIMIQATVTDKYMSHYSKGPDAYSITYTYKTKDEPSKTYTIQREVDERTYQKYNIQNTIQIYYLKDKPNISDISYNDNIAKSIILCFFIDLFFVLSIIYIFTKAT